MGEPVPDKKPVVLIQEWISTRYDLHIDTLEYTHLLQIDLGGWGLNKSQIVIHPLVWSGHEGEGWKKIRSKLQSHFTHSVSKRKNSLCAPWSEWAFDKHE